MANTPYYFFVDDRTTRTYKVYTTNNLEGTHEDSKLIKTFRYTKNTSNDLTRMGNFILQRIQQTGGSDLLDEWLKVHETA